jgi:hypothetical protein
VDNQYLDRTLFFRELTAMAKSYDWFVQRHRTRGLDLAHDQITSAFDTVTWLHKATQSFSEKNFKEAQKFIENLYKTEEKKL